ncbi:Tat pathway signal protein [Brevundimonas sp.]|uniref:Tat pathway signal protein n=1 Tax=Brevundimonas sp. TaxID=1871086 RepID=UPI0025C08DAE|nr:Tat pathway signal protein [Brevundimonas sp.]
MTDKTRLPAAQHQQMDRSNDVETTREMDAAAPELALESRQRLTGSAVGVGSVGFDESGAFDVGADDHDPQDDAITDDPPKP